MDIKELFDGVENADALVETINKNAEAKGVKFFVDSEKDSNFIPKSRFQEVIEQKNTYKTQADELSKQLVEFANANKGNEDLARQIQELQSKLSEAEVTNKKIGLQYAIRETALKFKAKDPDDVLRFMDVEGLELDEKGKVKGLKDRLEELQKNKPYLFGEDVLTGRKPHPSTESLSMTKEQFNKLSYVDRVKLLQTNPDLYNSLK